MAGKKKKAKKWIITAVTAAVLAGIGGGFYVRMQKIKASSEKAGVQSQVRTVTVARNTISETIKGSGTLAAEDTNDVLVPTGLVVEEVLVEEGDHVTVGDTLAAIKESSVQSMIAEIQDSITSIDDELADLDEDGEDQIIRATVSGRVKKIYAASGDEASEVMDSDGALLLLSVDGLMAVDIEATDAAETGASVLFLFSDGSTKEGTVLKVAGQTMTAACSDDGPDEGETVSVSLSDDGEELGSGTLYIHQPMKITASSGEVSSVHVSENEKVSQDTKLITLTGVLDEARIKELLLSRSDLTDTLDKMLALKDNAVITSPYEGTIASVNLSEGDEVTKNTSSQTDTSSSAGSGSSSSKTGSAAGFTGMSTSPLTTAGTGGSGYVPVSYTVSKTDRSGNTYNQGTFTRTGIVFMSSDYQGEPEEQQTEITEVVIPLTLPSYGASFSSSAAMEELQSALSGQYYSVTDVSFSGGDGEVLQPESSYSVTVILSAADGAVFSSGVAVSGITNNNQADASYSWSSEDLKTLTVVAAFSTDAEPEITETPEPSSEPETTETPETTGEPMVTEGSSSTGSDSGNEPTGSGRDANGTETSGTQTANTGTQTANPAAASDGSSQNSGQNANGSGANGATSAGAAGSSGISGSSGSASAGGTDSAQTSGSSSASIYSEYEVVGFTVTPEETMKVSINVDELDILSVSEGQKASVELDALEDQVFDGTVEEVSDTGTSSGGSTKYEVVVSIPREDNMLVGMSATATVTVNSAENVLVIPAAAVEERGPRSYVYTSVSEDGELGGEVEIETGLSTDTLIEVTSGLSEGQEICYKQLSGTQLERGETEMPTNFGGNGGMPSGGFGGNGSMPSGGNGGERPGGFPGGNGGGPG